eukprot:s2475_g9.t1
MAYNNAETMIQGGPSWSALAQLARAHMVQDKESKLLETIHSLGYSLNVPLRNFPLLDQDREHTCVPIRSLAMRMLQECPKRLLAGHGMDALADFRSLLQRFWNCYMVFNGRHPVFTEKTEAELCRCIPIKVHADEGTGLRKTAIYQFSWGPVIPKDLNSCNRYFFWSCIFHEQYKKHHAGFEAGNAVLDDLMQHLTEELNSVYHDGLLVGDTPYFLVLVGLEGDLPAQARAMHCTLTGCRNFNTVPNPMCPWCLADDDQVPYTDWREQAEWRRLTPTRPWTTASPLHRAPGGGHENILAKDLFHLCNLGAVRTFCVNLLCYLTWLGRFVPWLLYTFVLQNLERLMGISFGPGKCFCVS